MIYFSAIIFTLICSPLICFAANKLDIVDSPDGIRKVHKGNIALGGGLCLFLPLILCFSLFPEFSSSVSEAIKVILRLGNTLVNRLLMFDAEDMDFRKVKLRKDPECPVCGDNPTIDELIDYESFCGMPAIEA